LASLSREHHQALARARDLKRAKECEAAAVWKRFLAFWESEGSHHFAEEEEVLLPAFARVADPAEPAVVRTLLEHVLIRAKITAIKGRDEPPVGELNRLGGWLELHVRHEERVLFRLIEEALPETALRELGEELDHGPVPSAR
jgi:hypothetical protein